MGIDHQACTAAKAARTCLRSPYGVSGSKSELMMSRCAGSVGHSCSGTAAHLQVKVQARMQSHFQNQVTLVGCRAPPTVCSLAGLPTALPCQIRSLRTCMRVAKAPPLMIHATFVTFGTLAHQLALILNTKKHFRIKVCRGQRHPPISNSERPRTSRPRPGSQSAARHGSSSKRSCGCATST